MMLPKVQITVGVLYKEIKNKTPTVAQDVREHVNAATSPAAHQASAQSAEVEGQIRGHRQ